MRTPYGNVFLIESPLQLLNAMEAKKYFELVNNHLVVRLGVGFSQELFERLAGADDWDSLCFFALDNNTMDFESRFLGKTISNRIRGFRYDYQQYQNRKKLDNIATSFGRVKNIFLGNYLAEWKQYMRHFANTLPHETLYIIDDGTDVIKINDERKNYLLRKACPKEAGSILGGLRRMWRQSYIEWNDNDAGTINFFSAYDIEVGTGDRLIRNKYDYLREMVTRALPSDEVFFLGQCLVEDGYIKKELYLEYLKKIKSYFAGEKMFYIPHPRESIEMIDKIKGCLGFEVKCFDGPIEYEITVKGNMPKILASFFCSALQNCNIILGHNVRIKAFYLAPEHLTRFHEFVQSIYTYFENNTCESFEVVTL
ncbi:hypothetical protein F6V30_15570 [Oryzomonas sagensis]|uniref:Uncharacterized protein n=1 Tax=Oryzomonas sagensis TaxID=2603857 RepID=A0ABQ6TKG0_9BACT|nr:hypothetical protein [Oryzomonas sagensis]KAB0668520.1 hypothetical protein F6V30_15570 [Oryzomonas sagensis]